MEETTNRGSISAEQDEEWINHPKTKHLRVVSNPSFKHPKTNKTDCRTRRTRLSTCFFCLPSFQHTSTVASWNHSKPRSPVDCHNHSLSPILYIYIFQTIQNPSLSIYRNFRAFFLMIQNLGFLDSFSNVSRLLPPHPVPFDNHSWWRWQWQLPRVWRADNPRWNGKKKNDNEKLQ